MPGSSNPDGANDAGSHSGCRIIVAVAILAGLGVFHDAQAAPAASLAFDEMAYCASLGAKRPNSPARALAAERIDQRLREAGLAASRETYTLPAFIQDAARLQVLAPLQQDMHAELLSYGSNGSIEAEALYAGEGREQNYNGIDARGKIVIVQRSEVFHRQAQMKQIVAHGGQAMLYLSDAPDNLVQVGVIEDAIRPMPPIPAMSIGAEDGKTLLAMLQQGPIRLALTAQAHLENATGENVIGVQRGTRYPDRYVLVGGHYDSWYDGAVDNCTAVGTLLQMAHATTAQPLPYTTIFAAWDNEEVGLVGSYDWIINHQDLMARMAFMINLEEVSAAAHIGGQRYPFSPLTLFFATDLPLLYRTAESASLAQHRTMPIVPAETVRTLSGGLLPTDIQGFYTQGVHGLSTATTSAYYHTIADTVYTVDPVALDRTARILTQTLLTLEKEPPERFGRNGMPVVTITPRWQGQDTSPAPSYLLDVMVQDKDGQPVDGADVTVLANHQGYWPLFSRKAKPKGQGHYQLTWTLDPKDLSLCPATPSAGQTTFTATVTGQDFMAEGFVRFSYCEAPRI